MKKLGDYDNLNQLSLFPKDQLLRAGFDDFQYNKLFDLEALN